MGAKKILTPSCRVLYCPLNREEKMNGIKVRFVSKLVFKVKEEGRVNQEDIDRMFSEKLLAKKREEETLECSDR
jgi:hypothetical protein